MTISRNRIIITVVVESGMRKAGRCRKSVRVGERSMVGDPGRVEEQENGKVRERKARKFERGGGC